MKTNCLVIVSLFFFSLLIACNSATPTVEKEEVESEELKSTAPLSESTQQILGEALEENVDAINTQLAKSTAEMSPEEVINLYYNHEPEHEVEVIQITKELLENKEVNVTLINDNLADDSQKAIKIVMTLLPVEKTWKVLSIKKQWKCYEGRGHTDWGIEFCN